MTLLWSDNTALFSISGAADHVRLTLAGGVGPSAYFELTIPAGLRTGNFTVKLYKTADATKAILWSWHFWMTDYNPDGFANSLIDNAKVNGNGIPNGVFTYPVTGGQVERYMGAAWGAGGVYERKVIMDLAIGAVETNFTTNPTAGLRGQLHYQFGRKDPFPTAAVAGVTAITVNNNNLQVPISASVGDPIKHLNRTVSGGNWTNEASRADYVWNDPVSTRYGAKSIYDPCPAGWRVPVDDTLAWRYGRGIGTSSIAVNGLRYWPGYATSPATGRIWYYALGYRSSNTGVLAYVGSRGYRWSSSP